MIKYENANAILDNIINVLNNYSGELDKLIITTLIELPDNRKERVAYEVSKKLFKSLEERTHVIFNRSFATKIIERHMKNKDYEYSMERYYDVRILEEACRYKIKFVKLSQKTSQIKNRKKAKWIKYLI